MYLFQSQRSHVLASVQMHQEKIEHTHSHKIQADNLFFFFFSNKHHKYIYFKMAKNAIQSTSVFRSTTLMTPGAGRKKNFVVEKLND